MGLNWRKQGTSPNDTVLNTSKSIKSALKSSCSKQKKVQALNTGSVFSCWQASAQHALVPNDRKKGLLL